MPGVITRPEERPYCEAPYPHLPPPATDLDTLGHAAGTLPPTGFGAAVRRVPCQCRRSEAWQLGYATHQPPEPTKYHAVTYPCPLCLIDHASASSQMVPPGSIAPSLPAGPRLFGLGQLYAGVGLLNSPRIGFHGMFSWLYKHLSGDFGTVGRAEGAPEPTEAEAEAGPLASPIARNLLAIRSRSGLVRSAYQVSREQSVYIHIATCLHERGDSTIVDTRRYE